MCRSIVRGSIIAAAVLSGLLARSALAQDFVKQSIPMNWIDPLLPENLPELKFPAYFSDLDKAESESFHGRYKRSLLTLHKLKDPRPDQLPQIALIKGKSLMALGRWDEAIQALSEPAVIDDPDVQVQRARVLAAMAKMDDAIALLKEHLRKKPDSIAGHFYLGAISEQTGDTETARGQYTWFVSEPQKYLDKWQTHDSDPAFEKAENVTLIGRAIDRWGSLTQAYRNNANLHQSILSIFVRAFDEIDREYWPAHVAAAEYYLSHDQSKEAQDQLKLALRANPRDVEALHGMGQLALEGFDFDTVDRCVALIREVFADATEADTLAARNLLLQRRPKDAESPVRRVLAAQPKNLEALGLLAAVNALQLKEEQTNEILKQVEQIDPQNATAYYEVAEQLSAMRQYPRSAEKFKKAIERAPWWTAAQNGLGLLYTQSGDEDLALKVLNEAHQLDPFNLASTNYLRLLDDMAQMARKESDHFVIIYNADMDPVIPEYFTDYLESVNAQICATFHYTPTVKTYIEVFPTHDAFSVRTTGSPWIGTVGASTGRVIAMVSPRNGQATMGTFNWARVLRHEYTHTVTLGATDNRIQHWMTEGLAVYEERAPIPWEWVPMLYNAVKKKELFPIDQLTWSFVRPKRPIDRQLAYAESFWICKYIEETYGHDAILKMLDDFRNAERQEDVFPKVTGRPLTQFQSEFQTWCEGQIATWGYDAESSKKYNELRTKAEDATKARQFKQAAELWEQIVALRPVDALPHQRLAGIYLSKDGNQPQKAIEQLEFLQKVELKDNRYAKRVARIYRDQNQFDEAARTALKAIYIEPYDVSAHELLAQICEKTNDQANLAREKRVLEELKKWEEAQKKPTEPQSGGTSQ